MQVDCLFLLDVVAVYVELCDGGMGVGGMVRKIVGGGGGASEWNGERRSGVGWGLVGGMVSEEVRWWEEWEE